MTLASPQHKTEPAGGLLAVLSLSTLSLICSDRVASCRSWFGFYFSFFNGRGKYFPVQHGRMISASPAYRCPLKAVRLCLSACSSCIRSDSSVAAASLSFKASVSRCTAPPCWTGVKTAISQRYFSSWLSEFCVIRRTEVVQTFRHI